MTAYGYNARGQLASVTDPRGLTTSYSYNAFGNLLSQTTPPTPAPPPTPWTAGAAP